jgi:hypothetical protein
MDRFQLPRLARAGETLVLRPSTGVLLAVLLLLTSHFLVGCDRAGPGDIIAWHPIVDSLSVDLGDAIRVPRDNPLSTNPNLVAFAERLKKLEVVALIGEDQGVEDSVLGDVVDAVFLDDTTIAVLDRMAKFIRVYDLTGNLRYSVGGPGEGPGEMDIPVSMVSPSPNQLWVVEAARGVNRYEKTEGGFQFEGHFSLNSYAVRDACASGDFTIIHIPSHVTHPGQTKSRMEEVLYGYNGAGNPIGRFAIPYRYSPYLASDRMKRGSILCPSPGLVLLAFEHQNRLDAYNGIDGSLLWSSTFEGIEFLRLRERILSDGRRAVGVDYREAPTRFHFLLGLSGGVNHPAIIQFGRRTREDVLRRQDRYAVETFVLDPSSADGIFVGESLPQVLTFRGDLVALLRGDRSPLVEVARIPPKEVLD